MGPIGRAALVLLLNFTLAGAAHADDARTRAEQRYRAGSQAFEAGDMKRAYEDFKAAYLLSHSPALLYNMSSALQRDNKPHLAAEELRAYLRAVPDDPEQPLIEGRIRALEEAQRIIDAELLRTQPPSLRALPPPPPYWNQRRKTALAVSLSVGAVVIGVGIGLLVGLQPPDFSASTLSAHRVTP
jgi:hypothetical protein